jgi:hypothetical protein
MATAKTDKVVDLTGNYKLAGARLLGQHEGLVIYLTEHRPKTSAGRPRVYISVRHEKGAYLWRVAGTRTSANSFDVMLEGPRPQKL